MSIEFKIFVYRHNGSLVLAVDEERAEQFFRSSLWKVRMPFIRAEKPRIEENKIVFGRALPTSKSMRIIESLRELVPYGADINVDPTLDEELVSESTLREERSKVGLAIKRQDPNVKTQFHAFRNTIDSLMKRPLRDKQAWDAFFMATMLKSANFSVPGSGKTASVLGVFAFLHSRNLVKRVLVISPKNAFGSWRDEWESCFEDSSPCRSLCFHDKQWSNKGSLDRNSELILNSGRYNLILMNYESCGNYESALSDIARSGTLLVFDEVHKVKRVGGVRAEWALRIASQAKFVIALTGTPIPNSYSDIYNLLHILYPDDYDVQFGFPLHMLESPQGAEIERINRSIQPYFCRTNKHMLDVPSPSPDIIIKADASNEENDILQELRKELADNPLALIIRILQLESDQSMLDNAIPGEVVDDFLDEDTSLIPPHEENNRHPNFYNRPTAVTSSKLNVCIDLVNKLASNGKSVIVWAVFIKSIENIAEGLKENGLNVGVITGATGFEERREILDDFKQGLCKILITNPHTLAESVSLHSICHDAVYFEYSYNLIHLLQSKDRINRLGLPEGQYTQYYFLQTHFMVDRNDWSLDENIYDRLREKETVMLDAIDRGVLEPGSATKEDLELVFKGLIDFSDNATSNRI